jgi:hypothetical protein
MIETIAHLNARFSRAMSQLSLRINAAGELLVYQKPCMYKFPVVGFYGYSEEFEKSMLKSVEAISEFNPTDYSADELMHMYQGWTFNRKLPSHRGGTWDMLKLPRGHRVISCGHRNGRRRRVGQVPEKCRRFSRHPM